MAGSQYNISLRQLLECEKKLRLQSCIKLEINLKSLTVPLVNFEELPIDESSGDDNLQKVPPIIIEDDDIKNCENYLPVLTYLGGFCCYSVLKKLKCDSCKTNLTLNMDVNLDKNYNLIKNLDRGGLKCPNQTVVSIVMINYIVVKLYSEYESEMRNLNQRSLVTNVT